MVVLHDQGYGRVRPKGLHRMPPALRGRAHYRIPHTPHRGVCSCKHSLLWRALDTDARGRYGLVYTAEVGSIPIHSGAHQ
jgi:hypothetical protein